MDEIRVAIADERDIRREGIVKILSDCDKTNPVCKSSNDDIVPIAIEQKADVLLISSTISSNHYGIIYRNAVQELIDKCHVVAISRNAADDDFLFEALSAGVMGCIYDSDSVESIVAKLVHVNLGYPVFHKSVSLAFSKLAEKTRSHFFDRFSERQIQIMCGIHRGKSNRQMSRDLGIGEGTVRNYVSKALAVSGAENRSRLSALVERNGIMNYMNTMGLYYPNAEDL